MPRAFRSPSSAAIGRSLFCACLRCSCRCLCGRPRAGRCRSRSARRARRARPAGAPTGTHRQTRRRRTAARVAAGSRPTSNASCASVCMRKAISSDAIRASSCIVVPALLQVQLVHLLQQVELRPLRRARQVAVLHVADDRLGIDRLVVDVRALVDARAESCCSTAAARPPACRDRARRSRAGSGSRSPARTSSHEPMLGRIGCMLPEFIINRPGS